MRLRRFGRSSPAWWFGLCTCVVGAAIGCGLQSSADLTDLLKGIFGESAFSDPNATVIRIINQTNTREVLELDIDGQTTIFQCLASTQICDLPLDPCPQRIEAISERRYDSTTNAFQGGRDFNGSNPEFVLEPNEFECGNTIIFRFTTTEAEVLVL